MEFFTRKGDLLQFLRFATQLIAVGFTIAGLNAWVHIFGLPRPVFIATVVLAGMFFCGWGCPFGALQDWLRFIGRKITNKSLNIPNPVHRYLSLSRYVLWLPAFFSIWFWLPLNSRRAFLSFSAGRDVSLVAWGIMGALLLLSIIMDRPYCKYLCGFGSEYGLLSLLRIFTIKRGESKCIACKKCDKSCPMGLEVSTLGNLRNANCINCLRCVGVCPVKGALTFGPAVPRLQDIKEVRDRWLPVPLKPVTSDTGNESAQPIQPN